MVNKEKRKRQANKIELEDLGPGIRGRTIPREELKINEELVKNLANDTGSNAFAEFLYRVYKVDPSDKKRTSDQ